MFHFVFQQVKPSKADPDLVRDTIKESLRALGRNLREIGAKIDLQVVELGGPKSNAE